MDSEITVETTEHKINDIIEEDPYEVEKCGKWIDACNLHKVCLQFPDDLLPDSVQVALRLENCTNKKIYILGDTSCGSCCVDEIAAQHVGADGIIHFGNACLNPTNRLPVFHVFPKEVLNIQEFVHKFKSWFKDESKRVLFFYDVIYAHKMETIQGMLTPIYKNIIFSTLNCTSNVEFIDTKGNSGIEVLGRSFKLEDGCQIEDYEAFFLGKGEKSFTTLAMTIPAKQWYYYDWDCILEYQIFKSPWLKRRRYLIEKLKDAKVVGIIVATLGIKDYLKILTMVKNILKEKNKKCYIISVGKINPVKLANFPEIDAFVMITCPQNEVYDSREFLKPILTPFEVELAFNSSRQGSTKYCLDFQQMLPKGLHYVDFKASEDTEISLTSGKIINYSENVSHTDKMCTLAIKDPGVVAIGKAGAEFLQNRSWKGLEQRLGKDVAHTAEIGRSGLPTSYENEPPVQTNN